MEPNPRSLSEEMLAILKAAKESIVEVRGVGADLRLALFFFEGTKVIAYAQLLDNEVGESQQLRILQAITLMRTFCGATAVAVGTEGYASFTDPPPSDDVSLSERFARGDSSVVECITVVYANHRGYIAALSQPYTYSAGHKVIWRSPEYLESSDSVKGMLPYVLDTGLTPTPIFRTEDPNFEWINARSIMNSIERLGFFVIGREEFESAFPRSK